MRNLLTSWKVVTITSLVVGAAVVAPSMIAAADSSMAARTTCERAIAIASGYGQIDEIVRAESTEITTIAAWQEARVASLIEWESPLRSFPPSGRRTVCLYRGQFVTPTGPSVDGTPNPPHNNLRVVVSETGEVTLDSAGYAGRMDPETPQDWLSSITGD